MQSKEVTTNLSPKQFIEQCIDVMLENKYVLRSRSDTSAVFVLEKDRLYNRGMNMVMPSLFRSLDRAVNDEQRLEVEASSSEGDTTAVLRYTFKAMPLALRIAKLAGAAVKGK